ncbi:MAG: tetratricopeptide repeat protein [candidate division WOR-3 bacterium]
MVNLLLSFIFSLIQFYSPPIISSGEQKPFRSILINSPELLYSYQFNLSSGKACLNSSDYKMAQWYFTNALSLAETDPAKGLAQAYLGRTAFLTGQPDSAIKHFAKALEYNPNLDLNFLYDYGIALFQLGHNEDALSVLSNLYQQKLMQNRHGQGNNEELLIFLALLCLKTGKPDQAKIYLQGLPENLQNPERDFLLALTYYQKQELIKSLPHLAKILAKTDLDPIMKQKANLLFGTIHLELGNNLIAAQIFEMMVCDTMQLYQDQAHLRAGIADFHLKHYDQATRHFKNLANNFPNSDLQEYGLFYLISIYLKQKKNRLAVEKNNELAHKFPKSKFLENTTFAIAKRYYQEQSYYEAFREFAKFLKLFPKSPSEPEALWLCALSAIQIKDDTIGEELLKQLVTKYPTSPWAKEGFYRIGTIELAKQNFPAAKANFFQALSSDYYPYVIKGIADAYFGLAQYDSALVFYQKAESVLTTQNYSDSLLAETRLSNAITNFKIGKYPSYIAMLKDYLAKYPWSFHNASLQFEIGLYHFERYEFPEALKQFYKVFDYIPDKALKAKTHLFIARCYLNLHRTTQAKQTLHYLVNNFTDTVSVIAGLTTLAENYTQDLAYDSAISCYQQIVERFPNTEEAAKSLFSIAALYQKLNKLLEASKVLDRIVKDYPMSELLQPAYQKMIEILLMEGNLAYAETLINYYTKRFGPSPAISLQLGKVRLEQNRLAEAKRLFLSAARQLNKDEKAKALILVVDVCIKQQEIAEAKKRLKQAKASAEDERLKIRCEELLRQLED